MADPGDERADYSNVTDDEWDAFCEDHGLPLSDVEELDDVLADEGLEDAFDEWLGEL